MSLILPFEEIKIGPYNFEMVIVDRLVSDQHRRLYGQIDYDKFTIELDSSQNDEKAKAVLIHEVIHGIIGAIAGEHDEDLINRLEPWILMVLRDNPGVVRWIMTPEGIPLITETTLLSFLTQMRVGLTPEMKLMMKGTTVSEETKDEFIGLVVNFLCSTGLMSWINEQN